MQQVIREGGYLSGCWRRGLDTQGPPYRGLRVELMGSLVDVFHRTPKVSKPAHPYKIGVRAERIQHLSPDRTDQTLWT